MPAFVFQFDEDFFKRMVKTEPGRLSYSGQCHHNSNVASDHKG